MIYIYIYFQKREHIINILKKENIHKNLFLVLDVIYSFIL